MTTELSRKYLKSLVGINKDITLKLQDKLVDRGLCLLNANVPFRSKVTVTGGIRPRLR